MKIVKALSAICLFLFISFNVNCQVHSTPDVLANGSSQSKIDWNAKQFLLFSYFTGQASGTLLALSTDGVHWQQLNGGQPVIVPQVESQKLMRDPSINRGKDGVYRMVWTSGWGGKDIGYAESLDLIHWGEQKAIPVGEHIDSTTNCWAPEIFYDDLKNQYMIYWSSQVGPWKTKGSEGRIYYVTTKDFKAFSEPKILFRNGFTCGGAPGNDGPIDAFIYKDGKGRYILFYKKDDNSGVPTDYYRIGKTPEGVWGEELGPIKPSTGDEGPSVVKLGNKYLMFTDPFESDSAYVFSSRNLKEWQREVSDLKISHGTVIEISKKTALKLVNYKSENNLKTVRNTKYGVVAPKPVFRDPVYDGAADPVVVWNPLASKWWMFYTNRRANMTNLPGVSWVFGTPIGIAESTDGANWEYVGDVNFKDLPAECGGKDSTTFWAPDIVWGADGKWHMYLSIEPGIVVNWGLAGFIAHLTSINLRDWKYESRLSQLGTSVIDADILRMPDGMWRMYYKDHRGYSHINVTESKDLYTWSTPKEALKINGEGPIAFQWKGYYWLIIDTWNGQTVHRSKDGNTWEVQPGSPLMPDGEGIGKDDIPNALHANVVISNDRVYMYYFTHPGRVGVDKWKDGYEQRRTSIQVVELKLNEAGWITANRNEPTYVKLSKP
jgi:Beta-xylosidase